MTTQLNSTQFILEILRKFQGKYPEAHVGGSIGLFLYGFDLKRELKDLDITMPYYEVNPGKSSHWNRGSGSDFDVCIETNINGQEIEIDIRLAKEPFNLIYFQGHCYQASKLDTILEYKKKYADKGFAKHINDFTYIQKQMIKRYEEVSVKSITL